MEMYPGFAQVAREEGFEQIAKAFEAISVAEKQHGKRYKELADNLEAGRVFNRNGKVTWRCRNCGKRQKPVQLVYIHNFELLGENW
jgi:rubrerythrin